jgi:zinc protease
VLNPSFPQADMDRVRKITLAEIAQEKVRPVSMGLRVLPQQLYGADHAYSQPLTGSGTEQSITAMKRADLQRFHQTWFRPNHATLVVVGDITMTELMPQLERVFSGWKAGDVPRKNLQTVGAPAGRSVFIMDRPGAEQSVIFAGQLLPPTNNPDEYAFQVFNDAFGGAFGARVNMNLREGKHWSYGAYSFSLDAKGQRPWMVYAPVQTDKTKESLQEVMLELNGAVGARPMTEAELDAARDRLTRSLAGRWETGYAVASALQDIDTYDLPPDYYSTYADRIRAVSSDDVARVSQAEIHPDRTVILVVGDRAKIEAGIRELNLGPVQILDADGKPEGTPASP